MKFLDRLEQYKTFDYPAMINKDKIITYNQLWTESDKLALYLKKEFGEDKTPIVVYGHKNPMMLVAFIACVKSGHAYVPIDISVPMNRIEGIIDSVKPPIIITTKEVIKYKDYRCLDIINEEYKVEENISITVDDYVKTDDTYYIIFTSGSTGLPKGVKITYDCLNNFIEWALTLGKQPKDKKIFINQAPFSFDLSVMDLYMSLASGSTLFALDKDTQMNYKKLFEQLNKSSANVWVSTPSFADLCLADESFNERLLPNLELFLFCGETLTNKTALNLLNRFPKAQVYNTYGPTESTVAVTEIDVNNEVLEKYNPLPVGKAKPGSMIKIMEGEKELPLGESGEIVIVGNTVSAGYFNNDSESSLRFFDYIDKDGSKKPAYRTGDKGYFIEDKLFYCGRIDLQIKLHGYRIEIEDIEKNLMKVDGIEKAVVIPIYKDEKVKYLKAYCIYAYPIENTLETQKKIKDEMLKFVPEYMLPKKIKFVDNIPMTANGKVNRKLIQEIE